VSRGTGSAEGDEFNALLVSLHFSLETVGHPSSRTEPSYLRVEAGEIN